MKTMLSFLILGLSVMLSGCINISTRTQPDDLTVKEILKGSDCVPIIFSVGFGTADIEKAKVGAGRVQWDSTFQDPRTPQARGHMMAVRAPENITKVRRVEINDLMFLFFGAKCVDVVGEP